MVGREQVDRTEERQRYVTVQCAILLGLAKQGDTYASLSEKVKDYFAQIPYNEMCRPLLVSERSAGRTLREMSNRYNIPATTIHRILQKKKTSP